MIKKTYPQTVWTAIVAPDRGVEQLAVGAPGGATCGYFSK
jgi:hypothetical protein